jgi:transcriptional regulator GlxA family with amidase domain
VGNETGTRATAHQYVIACRVERAEQLLQTGGDSSMALVAAHTGFAHPSLFCHHSKRFVGVAPRQVRTPARIACRTAIPAKKPARDPLTIPSE